MSLPSSLLVPHSQGRPGEAFTLTPPDTRPSQTARADRELTLAPTSKAAQLNLWGGGRGCGEENDGKDLRKGLTTPQSSRAPCPGFKWSGSSNLEANPMATVGG